MSECTACGRWCPPDRETGYDADDVCPDCVEEGYYLDGFGALRHDDDDFYFDDNQGED